MHCGSDRKVLLSSYVTIMYLEDFAARFWVKVQLILSWVQKKIKILKKLAIQLVK